MRRALYIYHFLNLLHIAFYAYIMVRALNIANARAIIQGNSIYILIGYVVVYLGLSMYAKNIGKGLENPMRTVKWARILHFLSLAIFVAAFVLFQRYDQKYIYLMLVSFPVDVFAFILAYRNSQLINRPNDLLDDFSEDNFN